MREIKGILIISALFVVILLLSNTKLNTMSICSFSSGGAQNRGAYFGIGWLTSFDSSGLEKIKRYGGDFAIATGSACYIGNKVDYSCVRNYLDEADKKKVKVVLELPQTEVREFVQLQHPSLIGYYISYPDKSGVDARRLYKEAKEMNTLPIFTSLDSQSQPRQDCSLGRPELHQKSCMNGTEYNPKLCGEKELCLLNDYSDSGDILAMSYYPFYFRENKVISPWWDIERTKIWTRILHKSDNQFIAIIQGTYWLEEDSKPAFISSYPNKQQYRFYSIGNMIAGSAGIINFIEYRVDDSIATNIINPASGDIRHFRELFISGEPIACSSCEGTANLFVRDSTNYKLGVVNGNLDAKTISFSLPFEIEDFKEYDSGKIFKGGVIIDGGNITLIIDGQTAKLFELSRKPQLKFQNETSQEEDNPPPQKDSDSQSIFC